MASTFSYYAPEDELPCPLPTKEQILESKELLLDYSARKVVVIGSGFIVKYGLAVELIEGENLLFATKLKNSAVRAPKVYAVYEDPVDKTRYIIMERIHGHLLSSIWPTLTRPQKEIICAKINSAMDTLRKIPSPGGYCSLDRRPLQDAVFWSGDDTHPSLNGPFDTQEELNSAMIKKYLFNNLPAGKAAFYERSLSKVLHNHPPVFTHGDLQRKNIMITQIPEINEKGDVKDGTFEIVLLDWEASGWYPSYWEYSRAMLGCGNFDDDWDYWLGRIVEEYLTEWAWADMMFRELWS